MTAREWLSRGKDIGLYISQLEESKKRDFTQRDIDDVKFPKGTAAEKEIERQIENLERVRFEIIKTIEKVHDNVLSALLVGYYINGKTLEEMAEALNYSERHVTRLHKKALDEIKAITGYG